MHYECRRRERDYLSHRERFVFAGMLLSWLDLDQDAMITLAFARLCRCSRVVSSPMCRQTVRWGICDVHRPKRYESERATPDILPVIEVGEKLLVFRVVALGDFLVHVTATLFVLRP